MISNFTYSVHPETSVNSLRKELEIQLEYDASDYPMPAEYVFLKCVGRCLTQVCIVQLCAKFRTPHISIFWLYADHVWLIANSCKLLDDL